MWPSYSNGLPVAGLEREQGGCVFPASLWKNEQSFHHLFNALKKQKDQKAPFFDGLEPSYSQEFTMASRLLKHRIMNEFKEVAKNGRQHSGAAASTAPGSNHRLLRLWIVDDDSGYREGFARFLNSGQGLRVTRHFGSVEPLLAALAEERRPDIVVLDLNIGKENGLSAIGPIKKLAPGVKVLMLTTFNNTCAEAEAFRLGASGFLLKIYELDEIRQLIQQSFYQPSDPRLFPNQTRNGRPRASMNPDSNKAACDQRGFFGLLRQLSGPWRRQAR